MSKIAFYFKMAWTNIVKNAKFYVPYILTSFITITMFFTLQSFVNNSNLPDSASFRQLMGFGLPVVLLFSAIFLFYTNSFLIRRRKMEFGLFNILGMGKRHIIALIVIETVIIALISLALGIGFGVLTNKLLFLVLNKIVHFMTPLVFEFSPAAISNTAILFFLIYLAILVKNIVEVIKVKPIELLSSQKTGEKEPKAKWILAIFGAICIIAGYVLSVTCTDAYHAIVFFFIAVILVIVGTYCLFISGTIAILKILKKKKDYYYKPNHMASVSGMLFRMKQNGVGLANICILSTMVIVMIGTTVSLNAGASDVIKTRYPREVTTNYLNVSNGTEFKKDARDLVCKVSNETGIEVENYQEYLSVEIASYEENGNFTIDSRKGSLFVCEFYHPEDFEAFYEKELPDDMEPGVLYMGASAGEVPDTINFLGKELKVVDLGLSKPKGMMSVIVAKTAAFVVPDEETYNEIMSLQAYAFNSNEQLEPSLPNLYVNFDLKCKEEDEHEFYDRYKELAGSLAENADVDNVSMELRQTRTEDFAEFTGSFLFLGTFLGVLFLMATALIMYYKQIVEGYDDRRNFEIMQNVGMDKRDVKRTIKSQVLTLFFLPLLVAFCHMGFAIPILIHLLSAFAITNVKLIVICCAITCVIYAAIYAIVYSFTSKTYYRIVN